MRIALVIIALAISVSSYAEGINTRIIDVGNYYFMFFSGKDYKEIFRTPRESHIYGYGMLSNTKALFAYQDPTLAEAVAILNVIDTNAGEVIFTDEFGGAGEMSFDFSKITGKGVFNDFHGLNIIQLSGDEIIIQPVAGLKDENPYAPFWVDENTIGYIVYEDDRQTFKTLKVQ